MKWKLSVKDIFNASPVVPVMVIKQIEDAEPMTQALLEGGIRVFEITLRTDVALEAIKRISKAFPEAIVGAGTVINIEQYDAIVEAGAKFAISPGATEELLMHAAKGKIALIPGTATPSDMMKALALGYDHLKFFPAEVNGAHYLALECVAAVGGSWMLPNDAIAAKDWAKVAALTKQAVDLVAIKAK